MKKYKCIYYDGCGFSTTINDKELVDFSEEEIETILKPILCWFAENSDDEESRRNDYADFCQDTEDFLNSIEGLNDDEYYKAYDETYKAFREEYTIDKLKKSINEQTDLASLQMLYEEFLREFGEYEDFGYCDQCGSYNSEYSYIVEI